VSFQAVCWVLEHSKTRLADRLVLLAIANHAGTSPVDGAWESWPGVTLIAREANLAPRVVQTSLSRLEADSVIERIINGAPDDRIRGGRRSNLYRIITEGRGEARVHPIGPRPLPAPDFEGVSPDDTPSPDPGVHATYTPPAAWGEASGQGGVKPPDTEGCREATPKQSLEQSLKTPPPSREPRGVTPDGDTAGGPTIDQQPSEHPPAANAEGRRKRIQEATTILARRLAEKSPSVARPDRWIGAVAERLADEHAETGHRLLTEYPDLTPLALADLLDRGPDDAAAQRERQRQAEEQTRAKIRDTLVQPGNRHRNLEDVQRLRSSLGLPHRSAG